MIAEAGLGIQAAEGQLLSRMPSTMVPAALRPEVQSSTAPRLEWEWSRGGMRLKLAPLVSHNRAAIKNADATPDEKPTYHGGDRPHQNADQIGVVNDTPDYVFSGADFQVILGRPVFRFCLKSRCCSV